MNPTLDISAVGFSLVNARACVTASRLAYDVFSFEDKETDTQGNITCDAFGNVVIAFRGTKGLRDFLTDFRAWRINIKGASIHLGFYQAMQSVLQKILDALSKIVGIKSIFVTGHSLGGALAVLLAEELFNRGFNVHSVYTFGQPRVGNRAYRNRYNAKLGKKTFRLIHEEDLVARVPFWIFGYRGTLSRIFLDAFGGLDIEPSIVRVLFSDIVGEFVAYRKRKLLAALEPLNDHSCDLYVERLAA